jgi:excinuclease ABC subunit A
LNPHNFSFNSPLGWCTTCEGLGVQRGASLSLMIRDPRKILRDGAIAAWPILTPDQPFTRFAEAIARHAGFSLDVPYEQLDSKHQQTVLHGLGETWIAVTPNVGKKSPPSLQFQYKGVFPAIDEATRVSFVYRQKLDHIVSETPCSACHGSRLRPDSAAFRFQNLRIGDMCALPLEKVLKLFQTLTLSKAQRKVVGEVLREITDRLQFLVDVGLEYLTLGRQTPTLSGGESQRIRLASQIGSGLTGVLYVLDEPTIGLHPRDNQRLLAALLKLRDLGNTMILVEHDREIIAAADNLVDFGPGAGDRGGEVTAKGTPKQLMRSTKSLTGQYLSGKKAIVIPTNRRIKPTDREALLEVANTGPVEGGPPALVVKGARQHNLRNVDVAFPLGVFVAVTGVSGSGKSSLVNEVLYKTLARRLHRARTPGAAHDDILGIELIDKVINVDQDPIGNSPSSNPATYTGLFDLMRQLFSQLPESKVRGYHPRRFSFNKPGGRCEACEGMGQKKIEMHFLPDVWVECDVCNGARYNPETLAVRYKNRSIADVLTMRVSEALEVFANIPKIRRILQTLADVGLDYLSLGQSASTLSGGEAQRVKLAAELSRPNTGRTVYLLDEPTTGLHFDDVHKLLEVLNRLVDMGNTVIVVEHNVDVIKTSDWLIDLGPEAGEGGGTVVAQGTPEQIVADEKQRQQDAPRSYTAQILAPVLEAGTYERRIKFDPMAQEEAAPGDTPLESVGQDAQMPWEADGKKWHTQDRVSGKGKPCRWEGESLSWVEARIHELGKFGPTNWNHRSTIEIAAERKSDGWFLHAMTSMEWLVRLVFRVAKNTFKQADLIEQLGIKPLNETEGVQAYSSDTRVWVENLRGPWQSVNILVHRLSEVQTPAFERFLKKAIESFNGNIKRLKTKPEDLMPWKLNGEKWHLGEKGFPPGRKLYWDRAVLKQALDILRAAVPDVEIKWDNRVVFMLRIPGCSKSWGHWRTKDNSGLYCRFLGKKGQINLARVEGIGQNPEIETGRQDGDVLQLFFLQLGHLNPERFKSVLQELAASFRKNFAK